MSTSRTSQEFHGKPIVATSNGQIIGRVADLMMDPAALQISALVTSRGSLIRRETQVIESDSVSLWGQDVVLVGEPDVIVPAEELPGSESWLTISDGLKGHSVVDSQGRRIGTLEDIVVDERGHIVAYKLSRVLVDSPAIVDQQIPMSMTRSLGPDVLIVDMSREEPMGEDTQPEPSQ